MKWTFHNSRKLRGAFGETNFSTKTVRINKARHVKARSDKRLLGGVAKKDNTIINTIVHELTHKNHPKMHEKNVRKVARTKVNKMSRKVKGLLYSKFS